MAKLELRLPTGGLIDRSRPVSFRFDGRHYTGFEGDTLASALLANGVVLTGRSFKYHRPRGIVGASIEEPGTMVRLVGDVVSGSRPVTAIRLREGLEARSVNCWPSPDLDIFAVSQLFAPQLPAGFYYKTFMWPSWHAFEPWIRRAAGLAPAPMNHGAASPSETRHDHCDVLVVGAGPAGLMAAHAAARAGARVMLVDRDSRPGGSLLAGAPPIAGAAAADWVACMAAGLDAMPNVRRLADATAWAHREHGLVVVTETQAAPEERLRTWLVRARRIVVATGAIERMLVFDGNDRPGVMLASAASTYLTRYAVRPGRRAVVFTNNSSAYHTARDLSDAGVEVVAIVDSRSPAGDEDGASGGPIPVLAGQVVTAVLGGKRVRGVKLAERAGGRERRLTCDLVCVSGGWSPTLHLFSQARGSIRYDEKIAGFVPDAGPETTACAGAAAGVFDLQAVIEHGAEAGRRAAEEAGFPSAPVAFPEAADARSYSIEPLWVVGPSSESRRAFVDLQNDVTSADVRLAVREGFGAVEHVKRYTTAGMGLDQGKTGAVNVIGILADQAGVSPGSVGATTFRSPYEPIEFGAIAGPREGTAFLPYRHSPLTAWHVERGAVMHEGAARWRMPGCFPQPGESPETAVRREARTVRQAVGLIDCSPIGKIEIDGSDALKLLETVHTNSLMSLDIGQGRYGIMLNDDGMIVADTIVFRLSERRYLITTSIAAAEGVQRRLEEFLHCEQPDWDVSITAVTSQWASATVCGPLARQVLSDLACDVDLSPEQFPFLAVRSAHVAGMPARLCRVSATGELSFEIHVASRHGLDLWRRILDAGAIHGIAPVGGQASNVLRVEKGFLSLGNEVDSTVDPHDLGIGWIVSSSKSDFIGKRALQIRRSSGRPRRELVGLSPFDDGSRLLEGAPLTPGGRKERTEGFVTSCVHRVVDDRVIALGLLTSGRSRIGETAHVRVKDDVIPVRVTPPCFYDPRGLRMRS